MAAVLLVLLFAYFLEQPGLILPAIGLLVLAMGWPSFYRPVAPIWFGFSHVLGEVVSRVVLTAIFGLVTTPMGILRRMTGADSMRRKQWKKGKDSVFVNRDYVFLAEDLERPF